MYAVEFEAQIQNGVVNIPREYSDIYQSKVKVFLLVDEVKQNVNRKSTQLIQAIKDFHVNKALTQSEIKSLREEGRE